MNLRLLLLLIASFVSCGCDQEPPPPELFPLIGTVYAHDGKPVSNGGIIFIPDGASWGGNLVNASVGKNGMYTAMTSRMTREGTVMKPGICVGKYKIVYHPPNQGDSNGLEYDFPDTYEIAAKDNVIDLTLPEVMPSVAGRDD
jgi:hypothetical protein